MYVRVLRARIDVTPFQAGQNTFKIYKRWLFGYWYEFAIRGYSRLIPRPIGLAIPLVKYSAFASPRKTINGA